MKINSKHLFIFIAIACLYFAGVAAIVYPMISNVYSLSTSRTVISGYEQKVKEMDRTEIEEKFKNAEKYNTDLARHIYQEGYEKAICDENGLMCYVDIPTIDVYLPVYYGTSDEVLQKGCGYLENTSLPIGGKSVHSVISAHTGLPSADMFTKLDQVKMKDIFYIHVLDQVLAYRVDKIKIVYPYQIEELQIIQNEDYMTLLTCTPYGVNDHRLLVRGTRIDYTPKTEEAVVPAVTQPVQTVDNELSEKINSQITVIVIICSISILLFIIALIWLIYDIKHQTKALADHNLTGD